MSEPKDLDAQNLDLGALDDALGGLDDGVAKQEGQAGSSHKAGGQKAQTKPEEQGAYSLDDGKGSVAIAKSSESPHTLSPSSLRSASPNPVPVTADATQAADADTTSKIKAIRGMFPSLDEETVGAVLAAEGGNEENAINVLLSMSDPSAPQESGPRQEGNAMSDEALARSLAMEEDEAYARDQARQEQQRYQARQQSQPGGRGGRNAGTGGGMFQDFFSGIGNESGGANRQGARGGGGAAGFFNDLKQSVQPLLDGRGPLAKVSHPSESLFASSGSRGTESYDSFGTSLGSTSSQSASYDPSRLTYQPRVRKTPPTRSNPLAPSQQYSSPMQPSQPPPRQTPTTASSAWSHGGRYGSPSSSTTGGSASIARPAAQSSNFTGTPQQSGGNLGKAAVGGGAGAGAAGGLAVGAGAAAASSAPPPSVASVLQEGGHQSDFSTDGHSLAQSGEREDHDDEGDDDDDDDSDDLEFQKSPFDDED